MSEVTPTDQIGSRRWRALAALAFAMLTLGLESTIPTVALPTLARATAHPHQ
jgi:hypothetical protein